MKNNDPIAPYDFWDEYPGYPEDDWREEVYNGDTRLGYWEWVKNCIEWDSKE